MVRYEKLNRTNSFRMFIAINHIKFWRWYLVTNEYVSYLLFFTCGGGGHCTNAGSNDERKSLTDRTDRFGRTLSSGSLGQTIVRTRATKIFVSFFRHRFHQSRTMSPATRTYYPRPRIRLGVCLYVRVRARACSSIISIIPLFHLHEMIIIYNVRVDKH
jgi:hypothetical protein